MTTPIETVTVIAVAFGVAGSPVALIATMVVPSATAVAGNYPSKTQRRVPVAARVARHNFIESTHDDCLKRSYFARCACSLAKNSTTAESFMKS